MVLGPADAGKSSFCGLLLERAAAPGLALLDLDPGQKQVGPPGCVTLGRPAPGGGLALAGLAYLDALEPLAGWERLMRGGARLADGAGAGLLAINTCGLLRGPGRRLKRAVISALRPDLLVAIGDDRAMDAVLADHAALPAVRLARPGLARRKGEGERRALRRAAFQAYFEGAPAWTLPLQGLWTEGGAHPPAGRLVALADGGGADLALGLSGGLDGAGGLVLRAPRPGGVVAGLRWGGLGLDAAWSAHRES
nr:Clp1/GlmU family protein [Pararoseomonas baculiformis]